MGFYIAKLVSLLLLPPSSLVIFLFAGIILLKRHEVWGKRLIILSGVGLTLLSLPVVAMMLMSLNEPYPALDSKSVAASPAQAIVILGGGRNYDAAEYSGDTVSEITLERIRYGAHLHRLTQLPILVTGGSPLEPRVPEGTLMADALQDDFGITPKWTETESRNTAENASFSYEILKAQDIRRIFLVTNAWHMPRAVAIFKQQGFDVIPAPTAFEGYSGKPFEFFDFLPDAKAFLKSYYALHELMGSMWYRIRY